jgi:high affinity Mn2+ porin
MVRLPVPTSARTVSGPVALTSRLPARRIEIRAGKFGIADFFDLNAVGTDSHLQFTNWTVDNSGAYDYAADTRGYTYGVVVEYDTPRLSVRGAEALMPKVANGIELGWNLSQARGENLEVELRIAPLVVKLLTDANHANMGSYREAIGAFEDGRDPTPNIEAHRAQGRVKMGSA